jgi:hypothetical protein
MSYKSVTVKWSLSLIVFTFALKKWLIVELPVELIEAIYQPPAQLFQILFITVNNKVVL